MESNSDPPRRYYTTYASDDSERGPRPQRSSVTLAWSDGSKAIFIRPPRSQAGSGWGSPSEPSSSPPPPPPLPLPPPPAPPRPGHSSARSPTLQYHRGHYGSVSDGTSRQSNGGVRQGTPRSSRRRNETPSSVYSQDPPCRRRSVRHGTSTPQPTVATNNVCRGQNISRSQSAPNDKRSSRHNPDERDGSVLNGADGDSTTAVVGPRTSAAPQDRSQPLHDQRQNKLGQAGADPSRPILVNLEANIRGGSGRSPRQSRPRGDLNRNADGRGHEHESGFIFRGLRRCFPFSHWFFGESRTGRKHEESSPLEYRSRRVRKYNVEVRY
ncbi:hypothetical protein F5Y03DRAFT_125945 [Xylaria venustula]|nr:hypothetical protein F5Y03DRAFT_125945 [Xylaria venustula]